MNRKRQLIDKRLDWRDELMPVYKLVNGVMIEIDANERSRIANIKMYSDLPEWNEDETYDMKRKK